MYYEPIKYHDPNYPGLVGDYYEEDDRIDGGDCLQRIGFKASGLWYRRKMGATEAELAKYPYNTKEDYDRALAHLECKCWKHGWYVRHPRPGTWESKCQVNSRDQDGPNVIATGLYKLRKRTLKYMFQHALRGFFFTGNTRQNWSTPENHGHQYDPNAEPLKWYHKLFLKFKVPIIGRVPKGYNNYNWKLGDITFMEFWSYYIRSNNLWIYYPVLYILDAEIVVNALIKRSNFKKHKPEDYNDVLNHVNASALTHFRMPTLWTWLTHKYIEDAEQYKERLRKYFRTIHSPGWLAELWEPVIDEVMG